MMELNLLKLLFVVINIRQLAHFVIDVPLY